MEKLEWCSYPTVKKFVLAQLTNVTDAQTDRQTDRQTDGQTDGRTDRQTDGQNG